RMSVPSSRLVNPHDTAAPAPPEDPPTVRPRSHGLLVVPNSSLYDWRSADQRGRLVLPNTMAPAAFRRATAGASSVGTWSLSSTAPPVERMPAVAMASLTVIGNPCSGPPHSPRVARSSAAAAASRALST